MSAMYRKSVAWQRAMELTAAVYRISAQFPGDERFGLTNQIRRAAVSIPSNIAEGKGRITEREMARFLSIARGSVLEVQTQIDIAEMLNYCQPTSLQEAHALAEEVLRMLNASLQTMNQNTERA